MPKTLSSGDFVAIDVVVLKGSKKVVDFWSGRNVLQLSNLQVNGLMKGISVLSPGDSCVFKIAGANCERELSQEPSNNDYYEFAVKLLSAVDENSFKRGMLSLDEQKGLKQLEQDLINTCLKKWPRYREDRGVFILSETAGTGPVIETGRTISVAIKGRFLNGKYFDSSDKIIEFPYGASDQVVRSIEIALKGMSQGATAVVLSPSSLAFGVKGSSTGIVPPLTPVIFDLQILSVK